MNQIRRMLPVAATAVVLTAVALWVTAGGGFRSSERLLGIADHPGLQGEMFLQDLVLREMLEGRPFAKQSPDLVNYPYGEHIRGHIGISANLLLNLPFKLLLPPIPAHNWFMVALLVSNGLAMVILARRHVEGWALPCAAGAVLVLDPYVLLKVAQGFAQKAMIFGVPLLLLSLLAARDGGRVRAGLGAGLAMVLIGAIYPPYAIYGAIAVVITAIADLVSERQWRRTAAWVALSIAPPTLLALPTWLMVYWDTPVFSSPHIPPTVAVFDLLHWLRFFPYQDMGQPAAIDLPLGLLAVVAASALWGALSGRRHVRLLAALVGVYLVIAAGNELVLGGQLVRLAGETIPMPHALLAAMPFGSRLIYPIRALPFAEVSLVLLAFIGVRDLVERAAARWPSIDRGRIVTFAAACLVLAAAVEGWQRLPQLYPLPTSTPPPVELRDFLEERDGEAILFLPVEPPQGRPYYHAFAGVVSGRKTCNPLNWSPPPTRSLAAQARGTTSSTEQTCRLLSHLDQADVRWIAVLTEIHPRGAEHGLAALLDEPIHLRHAGMLVYQVPRSIDCAD